MLISQFFIIEKGIEISLHGLSMLKRKIS